jgi:hypothetical protein
MWIISRRAGQRFARSTETGFRTFGQIGIVGLSEVISAVGSPFSKTKLPPFLQFGNVLSPLKQSRRNCAVTQTALVFDFPYLPRKTVIARAKPNTKGSSPS